MLRSPVPRTPARLRGKDTFRSRLLIRLPSRPRVSIRVEVAMKIDGACHCGLITYEAEIDPEQVEGLPLHRLPKSLGFGISGQRSRSCGQILAVGRTDCLRENDGKRSKARSGFLPQMRIADLRSTRGCDTRVVFHQGRNNPSAQRTPAKSSDLDSICPAVGRGPRLVATTSRSSRAVVTISRISQTVH